MRKVGFREDSLLQTCFRTMAAHNTSVYIEVFEHNSIYGLRAVCQISSLFNFSATSSVNRLVMLNRYHRLEVIAH
jgi:hypothetical protein